MQLVEGAAFRPESDRAAGVSRLPGVDANARTTQPSAARVCTHYALGPCVRRDEQLRQSETPRAFESPSSERDSPASTSMQCHRSSRGRSRPAASAVLRLCALVLVAASMTAAESTPEVAAEHRSASAEPFLDRLASALFGSEDKKGKGPKGGNKGPGGNGGYGAPAGGYGAPPRPAPVYKRPAGPQGQGAQASYQAPVVATRPQGTYGPPLPPPTSSYSAPSVPSGDSYGSPQAPIVANTDSYGAPQGPVVQSQSSYSGPSLPSLPPPPPPPSQANYNNFGAPGPVAPQSPAGQFDPWQQASPANMAQIRDLQVQCEKDLMRVRVEFDRPFYGMIFSKGHYSNVNCVHVPSGLGQTTATFDIALQTCGMSSSANDAYGSPTPQGSFIENTIIVQYDPLLQEVWDQARKLRCTWYDFYEKAVTFKPYQVDMLDPVTANFLGDNLRCWMQIQVGKGPHASEVSGIVKIGQTMTMVLGVKDDENKFDMMVRNCVAHDGSRSPIQLVDERGCVVRPKIMSPFKKVKNFDATANVLAYAYFQAFKFPDSMNVHFQCVVQVCRGACPDPQCPGQVGGPVGGPVGGAPTLPSYPSQDSYGTPQAPAIDSYGSPQGSIINTNINPRAPTGGDNLNAYTPLGSEQRVTVVKPDGSVVQDLKANDDEATADEDVDGEEETVAESARSSGVAQEEDTGVDVDGEDDIAAHDKVVLTEPGYDNGFAKRVGGGSSSKLSLGGRPRALEVEELDKIKAQPLKSSDSVSASAEADRAGAGVGHDVDVKSRKTREVRVDANGFRILRVVKRDATEMADLETEKVIQVLAPNDVQFALEDEDKQAVLINASTGLAESICMDTSAFIGVTVSFLMVLIIALITIVFLWMRIKNLDRKQLL